MDPLTVARPTHYLKLNLVMYGRETALPSRARGERRILSAIEVVSAARSMVYIYGRSRVFVPFYEPCNHVRRN